MTWHFMLWYGLPIFSTGWTLGAAYQWWFQRGQCRSCRIRYGIRRLLHPFAVRMIARYPNPKQREQIKHTTAIAEVALAFAPMACLKLGWFVFVQWFKMKGQRKTV